MSSAGEEVVREELPGRPSSVGAARRLLRSATSEVVADTAAETAELLVSELVTNAVVHAGTSVELAVTLLDEAGVRVEVTDGSRHVPSRRHYAAMATTGRGFSLVEDLADSWGVEATPDGKTVWFEVTLADDHDAAPAQGPETVAQAAAGESPLDVELHCVPLLLHDLWQQQAEGLLRDYLLATMDRAAMDDATNDDDADVDAVARHASCSAAVALLHEHIPPPEHPATDCVDADGQPVTDEIVDRVTVPVPREAVDDFAVLDQTLDLAITEAEAGQLLAPATDAAAQHFRRWVCTQVAVQAAGGSPTPWQAPARLEAAG